MALVPFHDAFSAQAATYARYRPRYPKALFAWLASISPATDTAWDCATGSGQAALGLAEYFDRVTATDASAEQLAHATPHPRVTYRQARAEDSGLPSSAFDLVTVATAAHWLDLPAFYAEVRRVTRPQSVVAVWSYFRTVVSPEIDAVFDRFVFEILDDYWPAEVKAHIRGYQQLPFAFDAIDAPRFDITKEVDLDGLIGYFESWSAIQRFTRERGASPLDLIRDDLRQAWGDAETRLARWPLFLRVGRCGG